MTFERPLFLWALAGVPVLALVAVWEQRHLRIALGRWSQVAFVAAASRVPTRGFVLAKFFLLAGGFACAAVGFASPLLREATLEPAWGNVFVGLLIDVSRSTTAPLELRAVNSPSRWDEMRRALLELIRQSPPGLRFTAVAFTDVAVPLTTLPSDDYLEIAAKVRRLDHRFITRQGTNFVEAVRAGSALFNEMNTRKGTKVFSLILISDGDADITPDLDAELSRTPYPIYTIGVGSPEPVYIPDPGSLSGYLERAGEPVRTVLRENTLTFIATRTGARYYPSQKRGELLQHLRRIVNQLGERSSHTVTRDRRVAIWFFMSAFVLLLLHRELNGLWRLRPSESSLS